MGKLNEIRQKLSEGNTPKQLIDQGYAKSSVFREAKKISNTKPDIPTSPIPDELQDLRRQREIIKLQKEISEIEAVKEKIPDRLAALEKNMIKLRTLLLNAVDTALYISLVEAGWDREEAKAFADNFVEKNITGGSS